MTDPLAAAPARALPVAPAERIDSLDVLRGFAVLGIFIMNVQGFAMFGSTYFNPTYYGMWEGAGYAIWYLSHLLADQKFMTIFSLLFGAGIVLFSSRKEDGGQLPRKYHYRRMWWLIVFGLVHAYSMWEGDVLFLYGICGLWVYPLRRVRPARLIVMGLIVLGIGSGLSLSSGWSSQFWPEEARENFITQSWQPPPEDIAEASSAYGGRGYWRQVRYRAPHVLMWQTFVLLFWGVWRAGGLMVVGMGLYKLGVFGAGRPRKMYVAMVGLAVLGVAVVAYGVRQRFANDWEPFYSFFIATQYNYWGSLLVSGGYIGGVMLICKSNVLRGITRPFAAAGRMAFSNYVGQSIIASSIFYGHGGGYYAQIDRSGQIAIVAAVCALQLIVSPFWLRYFRFGPLEWLWRSLTYGQRQPFRL